MCGCGKNRSGGRYGHRCGDRWGDCGCEGRSRDGGGVLGSGRCAGLKVGTGGRSCGDDLNGWLGVFKGGGAVSEVRDRGLKLVEGEVGLGNGGLNLGENGEEIGWGWW